MSVYRELMRRKLLEDIYDKMSEEDKRTFAILTMEDKSHIEIMQALQRQNSNLNELTQKVGKNNWYVDFGSDVAANFLTDGLIWLGSRLFKKH